MNFLKMTEELIYPMGGGEGEMPTSITGLEYVPGKESDAQISKMLGLEDSTAWSRNKKEASAQLAKLGTDWTAMLNPAGQVSVIVLYGNDQAAFTKFFDKESHAISCALHHVLLAVTHG